MDPVLFIDLVRPEVRPLDGFDRETELLAAPHKFKSNVVLGFIAPSMKKGPGVSGVFNGVSSANGTWKLELAVELKDYLPLIDGKSEAIISTRDSSGEIRNMCISNRISRFHYEDSATPFHVLVPRSKQWHGTAQVSLDSGASVLATEEQLHTVVSTRFDIKGSCAEEAVERSIRKSLESLASCASSILTASRTCCKTLMPLQRSVVLESIPAVYVLVTGGSERGGSLLAVDLRRVALLSEELDLEQSARFRSIAVGSTVLDDADRLLGEAKSSLADGEHEFSFLQCVIAAELMTIRLVRRECIRQGVSKSKLDDVAKEMSYSWALNVGLYMCLTPERRPSSGLLSAMNAARSKRNLLMHEGIFAITRDELRVLIDCTEQFMGTLRSWDLRETRS